MVLLGSLIAQWNDVSTYPHLSNTGGFGVDSDCMYIGPCFSHGSVGTCEVDRNKGEIKNCSTQLCKYSPKLRAPFVVYTILSRFNFREITSPQLVS